MNNLDLERETSFQSDKQSENIETIRSCIGVMVEQTNAGAQFWDSVNFLSGQRTLLIEYLESLIRREALTGKN